MDYDYKEAMRSDISNAIDEWFEYNEINPHYDDDWDGYREEMYDCFWMKDSITGNASGSYTFNTYTAEEYLCHNIDLAQEACSMYSTDMNQASAEVIDVTIRCYLLGEILDDELEEYRENCELQIEEEYGELLNSYMFAED